jgi:MFS family permease
MRGFLVMFWQLFVAGGIALAALANISIYHLNVMQSWRWMFIAAGFPALILIVLVPFCQGRT